MMKLFCYKKLSYGLLFMLSSFNSLAINCPDPETTSLKWGVPPEPWVINPYSQQASNANDNLQFVRANILVAGYGRGVVCTYQNSEGVYSIWWETLTKVPARVDYNWIETLGGFVCTHSLIACQFYTASE